MAATASRVSEKWLSWQLNGSFTSPGRSSVYGSCLLTAASTSMCTWYGNASVVVRCHVTAGYSGWSEYEWPYGNRCISDSRFKNNVYDFKFSEETGQLKQGDISPCGHTSHKNAHIANPITDERWCPWYREGRFSVVHNLRKSSRHNKWMESLYYGCHLQVTASPSDLITVVFVIWFRTIWELWLAKWGIMLL